uniref:Transmembrane protein n=2 Tax=Solanum tuberosum TaxID=4113 RepID=M1BWI1_SOLTU
MPQPNLIENPIKLSKLRNNNINIPQKRNSRLSFWAFVFSICMYISIFYIFNLSPYTLINTTNFWFFISNTLILIIAIDFNFGSNFSSSSSIDQEYYMKICQEKSTITSTPSFNYSPYTIEKKEIIIPHEEEHIKDVVHVENNKQEDEEQIINIIIDCKNEKKGEVKFYRSNSELKAIIPVEENEKILKRIQRSKSERYNDLQVNGDEEINDEFLDMSVEELNRRVEEFIQRFNTQIRLQRNLQ